MKRHDEMSQGWAAHSRYSRPPFPPVTVAGADRSCHSVDPVHIGGASSLPALPD